MRDSPADFVYRISFSKSNGNGQRQWILTTEPQRSQRIAGVFSLRIDLTLIPTPLHVFWPAEKILNATAETADVFGQVKFSLKRAGTPLPINDVWIAAHALETGSVVVAYDTHFKSIPGLRLWENR